MSGTTYKGRVYWKDQCKLCRKRGLCMYQKAVELLMARLRVVELETTNCYGSLSFWCDYFQEDVEATKVLMNEHSEVK